MVCPSPNPQSCSTPTPWNTVTGVRVNNNTTPSEQQLHGHTHPATATATATQPHSHTRSPNVPLATVVMDKATQEPNDDAAGTLSTVPPLGVYLVHHCRGALDTSVSSTLPRRTCDHH